MEDFLSATRLAYDTVASSYAVAMRDDLAGTPMDRAMLGVFAEACDGPVLEVGSGTGRVSGHLAGLGVDVAGVDLSAGMVAEARSAYPDLRFDVGDMAALDRPDGALAGVVAWYSIIHTPPRLRPPLYAELARVLRPGGQLLMAFQVGTGSRHIERGYGHDVSLDLYFSDPDEVAADLAAAGITVVVRVRREPADGESVPSAYLLARRQDRPE